MATCEGACDILLVEDNLNDVLVVRMAFEEGRLANKIWVANAGEEALAFLRREGAFETVPRPDLVLLDWNMPRMSGSELLARMKRDASLKDIPVIVLTSSDAEVDVQEAYGLGANCYLTKPIEIGEFINKIRAIEDFWLTVVRLPAPA